MGSSHVGGVESTAADMVKVLHVYGLAGTSIQLLPRRFSGTGATAQREALSPFSLEIHKLSEKGDRARESPFHKGLPSTLLA